MKTITTIFFLFVISFSALFTATAQVIPDGAVLVVNEGGFQAGNASISVIKPDSGVVTNNIFSDVSGVPLGDIAHSITEVGPNLYIVVNNSQKIEVVDKSNFQSVTTITGFTSPRFLLDVDGSKGYVTDLFAGSVSIVDLQSNTISGSVSISGWTEDIVQTSGKVFIGRADTSLIAVVNPSNDQLTGNIDVGLGAENLEVDDNGKLWVLCTGGFNVDLPRLQKVDPTSESVELTLTINDSSANPNNLVFDPNKDRLYYVNGGVYSLDQNATALSANPVIPANGRNFYSMRVDLTGDYIYVADARDFVQNGIVYKYETTNYTVVDSFEVGIIPGDFFFYPSTVGIGDLATGPSFNVYPNPTQGAVTLDLGNLVDEDVQLEVVNTLGKTVWRQSGIRQSLTTLDLSAQPAGFYFVQLTTEGTTSTQKVYKK